MARYDRLRNAGLGPVEAMREAAPLFARPPVVHYLAPKLALGSNILLMALILLWQPRGLFPVGHH